MKIHWPWIPILRRLTRVEYEVEDLKNALERARVLKFIKVIEYKRGMSLGKDGRPDPILLKDLQKRIEKLESARCDECL